MSETPETVEAVLPPAQRKRRRAAASRSQPKPDDEFKGLTMRDCCADCGEKRCVITWTPFCGHPFKSSHPGAEPKVQARIAKAKKLLAHQKIGIA